MAITLERLAQLVGGRLTGGNAATRSQTPITAAATLGDVAAGEITFIDDEQRREALLSSPAAAAVVPSSAASANETSPIPLLEVGDVYKAFTQIVLHFRPRRPAARSGVSPQARLSETCRLGRDVDVHAGAVLGDDVEIGDSATIHTGVVIMAGCRIGAGVTIYPNVVLYEDTRVGPRSVIHAGAIIGADGFGYRTRDGKHELAAQLGWVEIGADVDIGPATTIDRGSFGPTRIGEGTKIDDQVMIAHNCQIGRHNIICSQVGIAGSSTTGEYVVIAGQAGLRDHVHIGDRAVLGAKAGVMADIPAGARVLGIPACDEREQMVKQAALGKLQEMRKQLRALQNKVNQMAAGAEAEKTAPEAPGAAA